MFLLHSIQALKYNANGPPQPLQNPDMACPPGTPPPNPMATPPNPMAYPQLVTPILSPLSVTSTPGLFQVPLTAPRHESGPHFETGGLPLSPVPGRSSSSMAPRDGQAESRSSTQTPGNRAGTPVQIRGENGSGEEDMDITTTINLANVALLNSRTQKVCIDDFKLLKVLGKGSYGKVMLVEHKRDKKVYAMKMLRKENIVKRNQVEHTKTERHVLENINHPFIVHLYYAFQTPRKLYFVMEYCPGGELFFHLSRAVRFSESRSRFYAAQIVLALEHLHKLGVIYRDLKPENVLVDNGGYLRLTDFGLSKEGITDNSSARSLCGTPEYLAPEILNQSGHGKAVDWWSLGALIYEMLTGLPPFYTRDREKLFQSIREAELRYPSFITPNAKSLMMSLFQRDPERRLGAGPNDAMDIKAHPFFASIDWDSLLAKRIKPSFQPSLQSETDVSFFDKDFTKMPIINSEVPDTLLGQAAKKDDLFDGFTYDPREQEGMGGLAGMMGIPEHM